MSTGESLLPWHNHLISAFKANLFLIVCLPVDKQIPDKNLELLLACRNCVLWNGVVEILAVIWMMSSWHPPVHELSRKGLLSPVLFSRVCCHLCCLAGFGTSTQNSKGSLEWKTSKSKSTERVTAENIYFSQEMQVSLFCHNDLGRHIFYCYSLKFPGVFSEGPPISHRTC